MEAPKKSTVASKSKKTQLKPQPNANKQSQSLTPIRKFTETLKLYGKNQLPRLLKSHGIDSEQFIQTVLIEAKKSEKMMKAFETNPRSLYASILYCAELGLSPNASLGQFFFLPFYNKHIKGYEVTPIIGYKGVIKMLLRHRDVLKVDTGIVYRGDSFKYAIGFQTTFEHVPNFEIERNRKTADKFYAIATLRGDGGRNEHKIMVLSKQEVLDIAKQGSEKIKNSLFEQSSDPQMWMYRKTVLLQLSKELPKDEYAAKAVSYDNELQGESEVILDNEDNVIIRAKKKGSSFYAMTENDDVVDVDWEDMDDTDLISEIKKMSQEQKEGSVKKEEK